MLNLNTNNDYSMAAFSLSPTDQQFYHNLYTNVQNPSSKDKSEFLYKSQKFDFMNNNSVNTNGSEIFIGSSTKDCENSKRFSVNNLLKSPSESSAEKLAGESLHS